MSENDVIKCNFLLGDYYCLLKSHIPKDVTGVMIILIYRVTTDLGLTKNKL